MEVPDASFLLLILSVKETGFDGVFRKRGLAI
jgi:hypothetical protein